MAGRRRLLRAHAHVDRADPASRQVRGGRGAGPGGDAGRSRQTTRAGLERPAPGHVRRAPARDLAAGRRRRSDRGDGGRRGLGRRSAGRPRRSRRRLVDRDADDLGHGRRCDGLRDRRDDRAGQGRRVCRGCCPAQAARRAGCSSPMARRRSRRLPARSAWPVRRGPDAAVPAQRWTADARDLAIAQPQGQGFSDGSTKRNHQGDPGWFRLAETT